MLHQLPPCFSLDEVPSSAAISVNGTANNGAFQSSGFTGSNFASAKIIPFSVNSL